MERQISLPLMHTYSRNCHVCLQALSQMMGKEANPLHLVEFPWSERKLHMALKHFLGFMYVLFLVILSGIL